jgi:hypothetical protein
MPFFKETEKNPGCCGCASKPLVYFINIVTSN